MQSYFCNYFGLEKESASFWCKCTSAEWQNLRICFYLKVFISFVLWTIKLYCMHVLHEGVRDNLVGGTRMRSFSVSTIHLRKWISSISIYEALNSKHIVTDELYCFVALFSASFLPQLLRNACPIQFLVTCFSYCFLSWSLFEDDLLWVGMKGQDIWSAETKNCLNSYFLLNIQVHFLLEIIQVSSKNYGQLVLILLLLPDEIRAFLNRAIWFWFFDIHRYARFIFPIHYGVST